MTISNNLPSHQQYVFLKNNRQHTFNLQSQYENNCADLARVTSSGAKSGKNAFDTFRGAAYTNDIGEGCKPVLGDALAKRMWYPSLIYVLASTIHKTLYNKEDNKDFSLGRGIKELAFQTMASLCGPILLVSLGKNTIGNLLSYVGHSIGQYKQGINPFKELKKQDFGQIATTTGKEVYNGIKASAKELPHDIMGTLKMAVHDIMHPKESYKNSLKYLSNVKEKSINSYKAWKKLAPKINANKKEYLFGKNGLLFGKKGLFGESGLLFGNKSSKVIGGLLGILLLYKAVDKAAEKIVDIPEKLCS